MGRITNVIRTSMAALLSEAPAPAPVNSVVKAEAIREEMIRCLGHFAMTQFAGLRRRIIFASDIDGLWYLRSEMMAALCDIHDEAKARATMGAITEMFRGLTPAFQEQKHSGPPSLRRR